MRQTRSYKVWIHVNTETGDPVIDEFYDDEDMDPLPIFYNNRQCAEGDAQDKECAAQATITVEWDDER